MSIFQQIEDQEFDQFWEAYPRKVGKLMARKRWDQTRHRRPKIEAIIAVLEVWRRTPQWTKENGQFIPHPATWLREGRWDDQPIIRRQPGQEVRIDQVALRRRIEEEGKARAQGILTAFRALPESERATWLLGLKGPPDRQEAIAAGLWKARQNLSAAGLYPAGRGGAIAAGDGGPQSRAPD